MGWRPKVSVLCKAESHACPGLSISLRAAACGGKADGNVDPSVLEGLLEFLTPPCPMAEHPCPRCHWDTLQVSSCSTAKLLQFLNPSCGSWQRGKLKMPPASNKQAENPVGIWVIPRQNQQLPFGFSSDPPEAAHSSLWAHLEDVAPCTPDLIPPSLNPALQPYGEQQDHWIHPASDGSKEGWLERATRASRPTSTAASFIQHPFGLHTAGIWELDVQSQSASLHPLGHREYTIISVSWIGAYNSHNQKEAWKKSQGFGIFPGDRPAWGKLAEEQDKGISEHIEPFIFFSFWSAQTVRTQDTISRSTTLQGDLLAWSTVYTKFFLK